MDMLDYTKPSYSEIEGKRAEKREFGELVDALKNAIDSCNAIKRITENDAVVDLIGNPLLNLLKEAEYQLEQVSDELTQMENDYFDGEEVVYWPEVI